MGPVDAGGLAGDDDRGEGAQGVGPGGEEADGERRGGGVVLAHIEIAVAVEFDDPRQPGAEVGGELVVVDRLRRRDEERLPARLLQPLAEVALVVVDEEGGVEVADRRRRLAPHEQGAGLGPVDAPGPRPGALHGEATVQEDRAGERRADAGEAPGAGDRGAGGVEQLRAGRPRPGVGFERADQGRDRPRAQLGVLVEQQAEATLRLAHQGRVVGGLSGPPLELDQPDVPPQRPHRLGGAVVGGVVEDEDLTLGPGRIGPLDRVQAGEQVLAAVRVHDAVGERGGHGRTIIARMADPAADQIRVQLVDPSAFTPPYDRALAAALARAGADVELLTSRFLYGPVPEPEGYRVRERFYRRSSARGLEAPARRAFKLAEHVPDMLGFRGAGGADLVHYQWLTLPGLDALLLPATRPRVMTAHYVLPPRPSRRQLSSARRAFGSMDAVVAHSEHGAARLREEVGLDPDRVRVIPHGAFDYLTGLPDERPLPAELAGAEGPVVLFFGLLRPYKGLDVLLRAFRRVEGAELWIVGNPRMEVGPLREMAAAEAPGRVRFLTRFVEDAELPAIFRRADVVVLPYRDAEHSGVLYTALAFGKPLVLSAVGGFPEVAAAGAARLVPPEDPAALAAALAELVGDERARADLGAAALAAASGAYSWDAVAAQTLTLYRELLESRP